MTIHGHGTGISGTNGFTLLELMMTLSIIAVLLIAAVPVWQDFVFRQQIKAATRSLHNDLLTARSQAIVENANVVACPGDPGNGCTQGSDWSTGWIVFADANQDRLRQAEEALYRHGQVHDDIHIHSSAGRPEIRFFSGGTTPGSNGSISLCGPGGPKQARKLVISNIGRIRRDHYPDINPTQCPTTL